jgi:hypothetical protein
MNRLLLHGKKFGRLTVVNHGRVHPVTKNVHWICKCDCGKTCEKVGSRLNTGMVSHCSHQCPLLSEHMSEILSVHGMTDHPAWCSWRGMMKRCYYKKDIAFQNYGGRGIKVCKRWRENFENFWKDMGPTYKDGLIIDRIDNNGDYTPKNCRWVTYKESNGNKRNKWRAYGSPSDFAYFASKLGVQVTSIYRRIRKGHTVEQILNTPRYSMKFRKHRSKK